MRSHRASSWPARRGQPLVALALLLAAWVGARSALWEDLALPSLPMIGIGLAQIDRAASVRRAAKPELPRARLVGRRSQVFHADRPVSDVPPLILLPRPVAEGSRVAVMAAASRPVEQRSIAAAQAESWPDPEPAEPISRTDRRYSLAPAPPGSVHSKVRHWSVDSWILLRSGGAGLTASGLPSPTYGASQAGGVVRYRLAPGSALQPAAYFRATSALQAPFGEEAAVGLAVRPLRRLPLSLHAELRATKLIGTTALRPAVGLVTEVPQFSLPGGMVGEAYGQAGLVGGAAPSAFLEGQIRADKQIAQVGKGRLNLGLGAWAGVQRGAGRADLGPSVRLDVPLARGNARIAADWRFRLIGNADPPSGPALTLSAGF